MDALRTTYVSLYYFYSNFCHEPMILLLTIVSVHQYMSERWLMPSVPLKKIKLTINVQPTGFKGCGTQMTIHSSTHKAGVSLAQ